MRIFLAVMVAGLFALLLAGALLFQPAPRVAPGGCGRVTCPTLAPVADPGGGGSTGG